MTIRQKTPTLRIVIDTLDGKQFRAKVIQPGERYPDVPGVTKVWEYRGFNQMLLNEAQKAAEFMDRSHGEPRVVEKEKTRLNALAERQKK